MSDRDPGSALDLPLAEIRELCRRHRVRELALFGSALGPEFTAESDVDLLVEFEPEAQIGFMALGRLQREVSELLGRPVDLVPKGGLKPGLRQEVLATARVLYAASKASSGLTVKGGERHDSLG